MVEELLLLLLKMFYCTTFSYKSCEKYLSLKLLIPKE